MLVSSMVTVLGLAFVIGILSHSFQRQLMNELKKKLFSFPEEKQQGQIIWIS